MKGLILLDLEAKKIFLVNTAFVLIITAGIFFICKFLLAYLLPFVIGVIIAFLMQKPAKYISSKTGIKTGVCAAVTVAAVYTAVIIVGVLLTGRAVLYIYEFAKDIPKYMVDLSSFFSDIRNSLENKLNDMPKDSINTVMSLLSSSAENIAAAVTNFFSSAAAGIAKSTPAFLVSSVVTVVASCYIAKDFEGLVKFLHSMISKKKYNVILKIKDILVNSIFKFLKGYLLLMAITFMELLCGLLILRVKNAPLTALLIAFIDILPVLGTGTVLIPWALISIALGKTYLGFGIIIVYLIITVVRNFLEPRVIGGQIGINPLLTLLTMFIGLKLFGFVGMIITPIAFIVFIKFYKLEMEEEKTL